jgi:hypothetical protein
VKYEWHDRDVTAFVDAVNQIQKLHYLTAKLAHRATKGLEDPRSRLQNIFRKAGEPARELQYDISLRCWHSAS